jgi:hypothetical protein
MLAVREEAIRMVLDSITVGPSGLKISPGDHVCVFYPTLADRDEMLIPYLREGLKTDHRCICIVDATEPEEVLDTLGSEADPAIAPDQLEVRRSQDTYLDDGVFSAERMLDFWRHSSDATREGGFSLTRAVGEITWAMSHMPHIEELARYEASLNQFLPGYPQVSLCLYELDRFSGAFLVDVLKTHPKILMGGMVLDNPYYLDPDEFLALRQSSKK